ncbi:MAG: carbohydrate binding family 9 domain-containing protein [Ignavibacteriaceae bacterium]|nr:carbohydrate binding family 9 domain-containing protein [Ignavibacteriaceae bacterium]
MSFLLLLLILLIPRADYAGGASSLETLTAARVNTPIVIDGVLEPAWDAAAQTGIPFEIQPGDNTPARAETIVRILFSNEYLYVSFYCLDPAPSQIRSNLTDRDRIYRDDFVGLILDTYGDGQSAYELFVNPHGVQGDILRTGNNEDDTYDLIWQSSALMHEQGYTIEMAIPFKSLRFQNKDQHSWKIMFIRNFPRADRYIFSSNKIDRNDPCFTCQSAELKGISEISVPVGYEILPFVTGYQSGNLLDSDDPASAFDNGPLKGRLGSGFKIVPSPSLTIEAVVNPDFSQVESDAQQISVNSTFSLFYQEKRPFFFEGSEIYRSPISSFYSRMINDPLLAAKVTGKAGKVSYALLSSYDRNSPLIIPGEERSDFINTGLASYGNILRARLNGQKNDYFGGLVALRNFNSGAAYYAGIDWSYLFLTNFYFTGQVAASLNKEINDTLLFNEDRKFGSMNKDASLNGEEYGGFGAIVRLERQARNHYLDLVYRDHSPAFISPLGFLNRNNSRDIQLENGYTENYDSSFITRISFFFRGGLDFNYDNIRKERWLMLGGNIGFAGNSGLFVGFLPLNEEFFGQTDLRKVNRWFINLNTTPLSWLSMYLSTEFGKIIYRGDSPEVGKGHQFAFGASFKPTEQLQSDIEFERAGLRSQKNDELLYDGYILRNISTYQFSRQMFLRLITDYNSFSGEVSVFPLFSYKLNPFTIFYIGSTHTMREYAAPYNLKQNNRQYFLKFQYLFSNH